MFKKTLFVFLILLIVSMSAFAGEGSDTIGACKLLPELRYSYYQADMSLKSDTFPVETDYLDFKIREHIASVQLNYGITDNIDLFAFVGARVAGDKIGTGDSAFIRGSHREYGYDLGNGFVCGAGVKGTFYRSPKGLYLGGGLSFTYSVTNDLRDAWRIVDYGTKHSYIDDGLRYRDSEYSLVADLHAGWNFKEIGLTPYVGVEYRWNREYLKLVNFDIKYTGSTDTPVGVYVGLDYLVSDKIYFNVEGHMIDRWGGSASVGLLFDLCGKPAPAPAPAPAPVIEPKLEPMSYK